MHHRLVSSLAVLCLAPACAVGAGDVTVATSSDTATTEVSLSVGDGPVAAASTEEDASVAIEFAPRDPQPVPANRTVVARAAVPSVTVRAAPDPDAVEVVTLSHPTDRGGARVFEVITTEISPVPEWLEVRLPIRPNGSTGWIQSADVGLTSNPFRITIDTSDFELVLYREDEQVLTTPIAVGTGDTPTPYGRFYITELLQPASPNGPYGPYAFGLSGFSEVLSSFAGGEGVIGIHGTDMPSAIGTNVSFGCVRVDNDVIETMASMVPLGTPVEIQA